MKLEIITKKPKLKTRETSILFVHGYWHAAWCWSENFMDYFAEHGIETHALSLRGHGNSEGAEKIRWTPLSKFVDDLVQVYNQIDGSPILLGHSMGGMIIQKYLENHNASSAIFLASAHPKGALPTVFRMFKSHPLAFMKANFTFNSYHMIAKPNHYRDAFFSNDFPEKQLKEYHTLLKTDSFRAFMDMIFLDLPNPKKVNNIPMLMLGGTDDVIVSSKEVKTMAKTYEAEVDIFQGMGHAMMLEKNWKQVADRIISWIDKQGL